MSSSDEKEEKAVLTKEDVLHPWNEVCCDALTSFGDSGFDNFDDVLDDFVEKFAEKLSGKVRGETKKAAVHGKYLES